MSRDEKNFRSGSGIKNKKKHPVPYLAALVIHEVAVSDQG
jgi:hypothetical protein